MNSINLVGRITKELELKTTSTDKKVCEFSIAVNRIGTDKADFINCQIWGTQADNLVKYQGKGSLVGIVGSLRVEQYQDKEGKNRTKTYVLVSNIEYLGTKKEGNAPNNQNNVQKIEEDPFAQMGMEVDINSDMLD